jgi:hypothetical protein
VIDSKPKQYNKEYKLRGDIIYQVYGVHEGREEDMFWGSFRTLQEAQAEVEKIKLREIDGQNWAAKYHNKGFAIREKIVDTDFEIPSCPKPRDKYVIKAVANNPPGTWPLTTVEVYRRNLTSGVPEQICKYERRYSMLHTFEPFRQGNREYALISRDYTKTAVLDLTSGEVIAEEVDEPGFCPVGFYVPDWWDINNGSIIPGSKYWDTDKEWPNGDFGFVWGCYWGDDSSWKVQYLDLSQIQQGLIKRQERFGYVELATSGFENPSLKFDERGPDRSNPPHFIHLWKEDGIVSVTFAVEMSFDLASGKAYGWERKSSDAEIYPIM